jgi:hypothetical protein
MDRKIEVLGSCNIVWKLGKIEKGLYMAGGPTMPPHLYLSLLLR